VDIIVIGIEEYSRRGWGPGGEDLDWYCTTATEAHVGARAVYQSYEPELTALMGKKAYKILADHCAAREEMIAAARASDNTRAIKYLAIHPATPKS
jgi:hypothetical protein